MPPSRVRRRSPALLATAAALLLTTGTAHAELTDSELEALTDEYLFELSLPDFTAVSVERPHPEQLDWTSDSCSLSPDQPLGHDFSESCDRHDFGYRNYTRQERFTEQNRRAIDDNFRDDMYYSCRDEVVCEGTANVYYWAVREFGGITNSTAEAIELAQIEPEVTSSGAVTGFHGTDRSGVPVRFPVPR